MTTRDAQVIAISTLDHKLASLFFDRILPLHSRQSVPEQIKYERQSLISNEEFHHLVTEAMLLSRQTEVDYKEEELLGVRLTNNILAAQCCKRLNAIGIPAAPIFHSIVSYQQYLASGAQEAVEIKLSRMPIIDTTNLEWEQILEVKADPDSKNKLRKLRLFLADNYEGKEEQYIRDSLLQKLDDYEQACKKHGLQLVISTLSQVLNSKSLLGILGISATAMLIGNPGVATASALAGSVIEVGKIAIHIAEKRLELESIKQNSEVSYLVEIQKRIN